MIRVIIDFTRLENVSHKRLWFPIDPFAMDTIRKFKISLCEQFNLKRKHVELYVKDAVLRDEDTILLLKDDDVVSVMLKLEKQAMKRKEDSSDAKIYLTLETKEVTKKQKIDCSNQSLFIQENGNEDTLAIETTFDESECHENQTCTKEITKKKKKEKNKLSKLPEPIPSSASVDASYASSESKSKNRESHPVENQEVEGSIFVAKRKMQKNNSSAATAGPPLIPEINLFDNEHVNLKEKSSGVENNSIPDRNNDNVCNTLSNADNDTSINVFEKSPCRKRRRRRRKPKKSTIINIDDESPLSMIAFTSGLTPKKVATCETSGKHIKFKELSSDSCDEGTSEKLETSSSKGCNFEKNTLNLGNSFCNESSENTFNVPSPKSSVSSKHNNIPKGQISSIPDAASDNNDMSKKLEPVVGNSNNYVPLKTLPSVGAHIAFKMYELSEDYCPLVTDYKEGVVKSIDPVDEKIEIELFKHELKRVRDGKFEVCFPTDSPTSPEVINTIFIYWSEMIDPQLIDKKPN